MLHIGLLRKFYVASVLLAKNASKAEKVGSVCKYCVSGSGWLKWAGPVVLRLMTI